MDTFVDIFSHADLQALHGIRSQQGIRSDECVFVEIVSLESVRIAHESYVIIRQLMDLGCLNPHLELLSVVGCLSLVLHSVEHDLLTLQDTEAKLEGRVVQALLSLKNSANAILLLVKSFHEFEVLEDLISSRAKEVGTALGDAADQVLSGTQGIVWLKECRVRFLVELVSTLMATPVRFPQCE
nr:unnamed protein product [Digitaria exilis]